MRTLSAGFCAALCVVQAFALPARAETFTVTIKDFGYKPYSLTVKKGDTVKFVNEDEAPHTVTPFKDANFKEITKLAKGQSGSIIFNQPGKQKYYCDIHPAMEGVVLVK